MHADMELEESQADEGDHSLLDSSDAARHSAALFILKTTEKHNLPLSAVETLTSNISSLVGNAVHQVGELVSAALSLTGADTTVVSQICSEEAIINPFLGLESTYMQTKFFRETLRLLVSG